MLFLRREDPTLDRTFWRLVREEGSVSLVRQLAVLHLTQGYIRYQVSLSVNNQTLGWGVLEKDFCDLQ